MDDTRWIKLEGMLDQPKKKLAFPFFASLLLLRPFKFLPGTNTQRLFPCVGFQSGQYLHDEWASWYFPSVLYKLLRFQATIQSVDPTAKSLGNTRYRNEKWAGQRDKDPFSSWYIVNSLPKATAIISSPLAPPTWHVP